MNEGRVFGFAGRWLPRLRVYGREVGAVIRVDVAELERRQEICMEPLCDPDLMSALAVLPYRTPISWDTIDPVIQATLDNAPEGTLLKGRRTVERIYRPALDVVGIVKRSKSWLVALEAVSLFAPHAPRGLVLLGQGDDRSVRLRAVQVGVGLARHQPVSGTVLLERPSRAHVRGGPKHWAFTEVVLAQWLELHNSSAQAFS